MLIQDGLVFVAWVVRPFHGGALVGPSHVQGDNKKTLCNKIIRINWETDIHEANQVTCSICKKRLAAIEVIKERC